MPAHDPERSTLTPLSQPESTKNGPQAGSVHSDRPLLTGPPGRGHSSSIKRSTVVSIKDVWSIGHCHWSSHSVFPQVTHGRFPRLLPVLWDMAKGRRGRCECLVAATAQVTIPWVVLMVTARTTMHIPSPRHRPHPSYTSTPPSSLVFQRHLESVRLCSSLSPSILGQRVGRDPAERAQ